MSTAILQRIEFSAAADRVYAVLRDAQRIVQAWRVGNWPDGLYSIARFELTAMDGGSRLNLTHDGFPDQAREHLEAGWRRMYWEPLAKYLTIADR